MNERQIRGVIDSLLDDILSSTEDYVDLYVAGYREGLEELLQRLPTPFVTEDGSRFLQCEVSAVEVAEDHLLLHMRTAGRARAPLTPGNLSAARALLNLSVSRLP